MARTKVVNCSVMFDDGEYYATAQVTWIPGVRTLSNGDPGWPDESDLQVDEVRNWDGDDVTERYMKDAAFANIIDNAVWDTFESENL